MDEPGTNSLIKDFKDLEVWRAARQLRMEMYKVAERFPDTEKFGLGSQIRRAAVSVTANIAEGFGRYGYQENVQHCRQARGSLYELRDHLVTCVDQGLLDREVGKKLDAMARRVVLMLNGYLRSTLALKKAADREKQPDK
jgi:four helix bundle protein